MSRLAVALTFVLAFGPAEGSQDRRGSSAKPNPEGRPRPLQVFLLAGQSNMQGHARVSTFDGLADDPRTAPLLKEMRQPDGQPRVCKNVWISSVGCLGDAYSDLTEAVGRLTVGFGAPENKIGPEFTFGLTLEKTLNEPILIIKTAWGGRSLHTDFRPPSAGAFEWNEAELAQRQKRGDDIAKLRAEKVEATGVYYREMIAHARKVLKDIGRVVPDYDEQQGYELAGFVWFQGFNDYVDGGVYPDQMQSGGYDLYGELLAHLIRDVRKDLSAPKMPAVIGVMGIGGAAEGRKAPQMHFRQAQVAVASLQEFQGNVRLVLTENFWDDDLSALRQRFMSLHDRLDLEFKKHPQLTEEDKQAARFEAIAQQFTDKEQQRLQTGVSDGDYHYLGAAKILAPIGKAFAEAVIAKVNPAQPAELAGYLLAPHSQVDKEFNGGFSLYAAAWPLLHQYPGDRFQTGLLGTWMFAQYDGDHPKEACSDIEGGLGWWRDTRFATTTPKFIMGGVAREFCEWANGPGAGKGRDWENPAGHYAVAQLSPWVLWPPDGLNLKQGTSGELFGYGYLPLPLIPAKKATAGKDVPTGDQCWTLFLNTGNFKGPVAFFTPYFWSKPTVADARFAGLFLDTRPAEPNKAVQMETQFVPAFLGADAQGRTFARVSPISFPRNEQGEAVVIHRLTAYKKAALWDEVKNWLDGGEAVSGAIDPTAATVHKFSDQGGSTWELSPNTPNPNKIPIRWNDFATPVALDEQTYGYRWDAGQVTSAGSLTVLPEYYRLGKNELGKDEWQAVSPTDVPAETGLANVSFGRPVNAQPPEPYVTPDDPASSWKQPGPAAGPFQAKLGDGSVVTYFWYRFADQPALLHADLTDDEREELQKKVEKIHRQWTKDQEYLPPNTLGTLAELDPAVLVTPPRGLEIGYVPIVTRQEAR